MPGIHMASSSANVGDTVFADGRTKRRRGRAHRSSWSSFSTAMTIRATGSDQTRKSPAVSIVIAAYNASAYIAETLNSIAAQTFTDYEVIIVNDGSNDTRELEAILESHPLDVVYISQVNRGVSAARNAAIKVASGEFYAQLDSDDQWN